MVSPSTIRSIIISLLFAGVIAWLIILQVTKGGKPDEEEVITPTEIVPVTETPVTLILIDPSVFVDQIGGDDNASVFNDRNSPFKTVEGALTFIEDQNQLETWSGTAQVKLFVGTYAVDLVTEWKVNLAGGLGTVVTLTTENRTFSSVTVEVQSQTEKFVSTTLVQEITFTPPGVVPVGTFFMVFEGKRFICKTITTSVVQVPVAIANLVPGSMVQLVQVGTVVNMTSNLEILMSNGTMNVEDIDFDVGSQFITFGFAPQGEQKDALVNIKWCIFQGDANVNCRTTCNISNSFLDNTTANDTVFLTTITGSYIETQIDLEFANANVIDTRCGNIRAFDRCVLTGANITCQPSTGVKGIDLQRSCVGNIQVAQIVESDVAETVLEQENCAIEFLQLFVSNVNTTVEMFLLQNNCFCTVADLIATAALTGTKCCNVQGASKLTLLGTSGGTTQLQGDSVVGGVSNHKPTFTGIATVFEDSGSTLVTGGS